MAEVFIRIEFGKSRSRKYETAVNLMKELPNHNQLNQEKEWNTCEVIGIKDFLKHFIKIEKLISIISQWKTTKIIFSFNNEIYNGNQGYYNFKDMIKLEAEQYEVFLHDNEYGMDAATFEDLPMPVVYYPSMYGAFFAFSKDIDEQLFFCECQRKAIENYIKLRKQSSLHNYVGLKTAPLGIDYFPKIVAKMSLSNNDNPLYLFKFRENICFKCNEKIPILKYCSNMYGTAFKQKYGWYVKQKYFEIGIDPYQIADNVTIQTECPPDIYDSIIQYEILCKHRKKSKYNENLEERISLYRKGIEDSVENITRVELGFPKIGESWISETVLFNIAKGLYPTHEIIRHHRPKWLEGLELDIFIPDLNLAFEYQGIQHYKPIKHWGGVEQLERQQENDRRKAKICESLGVLLITIDYNEELSTENIKNKVADSM